MTPNNERSVIVTGAASGIGRAIAERLVGDGFQVLAVDLEPDDDAPGEPFAADLTTREGNRDAVDAALERFGRLDAIVPNAGFQHVAPVAEFPEDRWDALLAILLTSPFLLARYAWPALERSGDGRIVAIASVHGLVASPFKAGYVAAKHGVMGLVKTLALEGADKGITATAAVPGLRAHPARREADRRSGARARPAGGARARGRHPPTARGQAADRAGRGGRRGGLPTGPGRARLHRRARDHGPRVDGALSAPSVTS